MKPNETPAGKERLRHCCRGLVGCFYHFVGNIGEASSKHYCGATSKDGLMTYGQDAIEVKTLARCPLGYW